jgi:predicted DsbA family dithiol-disulfide isomerase
VRIERLRQRYNIRLRWVHFPLHPETPTEGMTLEALFAGRGFDVAEMNAQMAARMAAEGLPYGERTHTYNSRLAQELAKWAETQPGGEAIHDALFRAYFVDGVNLAKSDELVRIAGEIGLSTDEAERVIAGREFQAAIDADWQRSHAHGVTGVPTFLADGQAIVGAQPYEALEQLVLAAGAQRR